ncbi:arylsulfatase [uncultured Algibacter sp.]|uniref:arylsulfatase n=1 Tax=uncultured Algibacter sp. TaxID=298659 RepID=UPI00262C96A2|nr:arylsulfatase [uncultured Algibacter sp.]
MSFKKLVLIWMLLVSYNYTFAQSKTQEVRKPNVILVLTDDQGIGDIGCHGNPWLNTPNLDKFYKNAVRMTDFHVSPVCTPTRGAIMTGRYPINNGAWATYKGRDALSTNNQTMADIFKVNGYVTGIFGKWHLGDNYPVRPTDCGFDVAIHHKSGGVGELSDYWGNTYFDDVYWVNNEPKQFEGYCTDVWFNETIKFIDKNKDKPFFIYLPTNAPHDPHYVAEKYAKPYRSLVGKEIFNAEFYGMISNIDENFGKLEAYLKKVNLTDNTILIFMTDNGTQYGYSADGKLGYNNGFQGRKGERFEGSHRVPFFIRWKDGKIKGGKDIDAETAHVDLIPTLAELCELSIPDDKKLDGVDFSGLLTNKHEKLADRTIFVHNRQDWRPPTSVTNTCIIKNDWRLINGKNLFDIEKDRLQKNDVSKEFPEITKELLKSNSKFIKTSKTYPEYNELPVSIVGNENQLEITLTIQHAIGESTGIWKAEHVAEGKKNSNNTHAIEVEKDGIYQIECRRWPKECPGSIWGVPENNPKNFYKYKTIKPEKVRIRIANQILEKPIDGTSDAVIFNLKLSKGKTLLLNDFIEGDETYGVYYTYIKHVSGKTL